MSVYGAIVLVDIEKNNNGECPQGTVFWEEFTKLCAQTGITWQSVCGSFSSIKDATSCVNKV